MENVRRIGFAVNRADDTVGKIVEEVGKVVSGSLNALSDSKIFIHLRWAIFHFSSPQNRVKFNAILFQAA